MVPSHARVVIVGGGIMGCSLLYHLAKEGWHDCVLIEKAELTSGSTWHAAGQITHSTSSYALGKMAGYGIELYKRIEEETEQSVSFHDCGSLRLAYTADELDWLKHTMSVGATLDHPMEIIGVDEIRALHPFYNLEGVRAALHTPADGHVDPAGATHALARGARNLGAKIIRHNRVTNIAKRPDGGWRVSTEQGEIACEIVVNAGGTYAKQIGAWVGLNLPITCMTHHYLVTDTVTEFEGLDHELPVVRDDRMVSGYVRMEQKSGLIGIYEKANPNTVWLEGTPWEAEHELFEPDYDRISPWLENALERMPVLADKGIKRAVHGAITHPPDGNMLLGPAPGLCDFWCCCGSQIGIAWGPGAGKFLAQWMVHGAAEINMREFDPRRYGDFADAGYAVAKAKEDYLLRHEIPFPGLNRTEGRPVKTSPLYDRLLAEGAVYEEIFGWERPRWFAHDGVPQRDMHSFRRTVWHDCVAREIDAVRNRLGVMDLSSFAKIEVSGPDAGTFVDRVIANRTPVKAGRLVLTHILNEKGTIEAETTVIKIGDDRFYFVFAAFSELRVFDWLNQHRHDDEEISIVNASEIYGALALQGPLARDVLRRVCQAPLDNESFPWLTAQTVEIAGAPLRALRMSYSGELGWELHMPMDRLPAVYDALWQAGSSLGIANYGSYAMNSMRLEKGFKGAHELTTEVTLPEADVMRFVKLDKDFIGRNATERSMNGDLPWICTYLAIDTEDADCHGSEAVFKNGHKIGAVSSGGYGHHVGETLAFAYLDPAMAEPGAELEVMILGERRPARILAEPAYDPRNSRPRS
ncbi:MAG: FAD-dependent oxidoreductase [Alphaproteobacteria bacterium]|nr:FAD-dependent oxidoreductase [Alphaproteobacteria bacterium]